MLYGLGAPCNKIACGLSCIRAFQACGLVRRAREGLQKAATAAVIGCSCCSCVAWLAAWYSPAAAKAKAVDDKVEEEEDGIASWSRASRAVRCMHVVHECGA